MSKFKVVITRTDEYHVELDENVFTEEYLKKWSKTFNEVESIEDMAKDYALFFMRNNHNDSFLEGYGYVKEFRIDGELKPIPWKDANNKYTNLPDNMYSPGISITPIDQDEDYQFEIEKILPEKNKKTPTK